MTPYHDRTPALLRAEDFDTRLNGTLGAARCVNRSGEGDDDPTIIEENAA
jgi:hypothetical protein